MSRIGEITSTAKERFAQLRERHPFLDHLVRTQQHSGEVNSGQQAGAITYFGFLSFFPILALAFFVIGYVVQVYPEAESDLIDGIDGILPGLVGNGADQISLDSIQTAAGAVGLIGVVGVLYAGLGWLSSLRGALTVVFELPDDEQLNFVLGKVRDLITLGLVGFVLVASVAISGVVAGFSSDLLDLVGLGTELAPLLVVISIALGLAANSLLFFTIFRLLANPDLPAKALWSGALLGAVGFEVLKQLSTFLLASTKNQPAFQAFGITLILLVWINYFSKLVLFAASWAATSEVTETAEAETPRPITQDRESSVTESESTRLAAFAVGAGAAAAVLAVVARRKD